ncbi:MAG: hypothetical protein LBT76_00350 [Tannerella sp.]|jgi:hypothetical protein|nr:hypothetical protein [Tannerella sp.]
MVHGHTAERLQKEEVAQLHSQQLEETAGAQQSMQDRDHAFDELCDRFSDFRAIFTPSGLQLAYVIPKADLWIANGMK